jgi:hypothetical protein
MVPYFDTGTFQKILNKGILSVKMYTDLQDNQKYAKNIKRKFESKHVLNHL